MYETLLMLSYLLLAAGWWPFGACLQDCSYCNSGETPEVLEVSVSGFVNDSCTSASAFNTTFSLTQTSGNPCVYDTTVSGGEHDDSGCTSANITVTVTLDPASTTIVITCGNDTFNYSTLALGASPTNCCDDFTPPASATYDSQATSNTNFGHDGSGASVSVECTV